MQPQYSTNLDLTASHSYIADLWKLKQSAEFKLIRDIGDAEIGMTVGMEIQYNQKPPKTEPYPYQDSTGAAWDWVVGPSADEQFAKGHVDPGRGISLQDGLVIAGLVAAVVAIGLWTYGNDIVGGFADDDVNTTLIVSLIDRINQIVAYGYSVAFG